MNAIDLLEKQHKEVKSLLEKVVETSGQEGARLLEEITQNLLGHMVIEQEIFYPAAAKGDLPDIDEGYEEHFVAREMINRALQTKGDKVLFQARCKVLKELIEHHVEEEEEKMFPKVKKDLGSDRLDALGADMEPLFEQCQAMGLAALARRVDKSEILADTKKASASASPKRKAARSTETVHGKSRKAAATRHGKSATAKSRKR